MSRLFGGTPKQKLPVQQETEPIATVTEDATEAGRRRRKRLVTGGAASTRISGIRSAVTSALKRRLGE